MSISKKILDEIASRAEAGDGLAVNYMRQRVGDSPALSGAPDSANIKGVGRVGLGQDSRIIESSRAYANKSGIPLTEVEDYKRIDPNFAKNVADEFAKLKHDPNNPSVKESYDALKKETLEQYKQMISDGIEPYFLDANSTQNSPYEALIELTEDRRLGIFPTREGYGDGASQLDIDDDPLLEETGLLINGKPLLYNDAFRGVHDYYGHGKSGVGFRAMGEENAYRSHAGMYSPAARPAAATETRGQNSWLNFGPHGDFNKTANTDDTIFAEQTKALLPNWAVTQGTPLGDKRLRDILENDRTEAFGNSRGFKDAIDSEGRVKLKHYSRGKIDTIDPQNYGEGLSGRTKSEKNRAADPSFLNRSFYGIEGTDNPYTAELGLGSVKNNVEFPISQLYDMANDPENYISQIPTKSPKGFALSPQERNTLLEQKIKSEGWSGMFDRGAGGDTATLFEPLDVGKRYDLASGVLLSGLAAKPTYNAMDDLFAGGELASNLVGSTLLSLGEESLSGLKALGTGDPYARVDLPDYPFPVSSERGQEMQQSFGNAIAPYAEDLSQFSNEWADEGARYDPAIGALRRTLFETPIIGDALGLIGGLGDTVSDSWDELTDYARQDRLRRGR